MTENINKTINVEESSDSNNLGTRPAATEPLEEYSRSGETQYETIMNEPGPQPSAHKPFDMLPSEEWAKMTKSQRRNYLRRRVNMRPTTKNPLQEIQEDESSKKRPADLSPNGEEVKKQKTAEPTKQKADNHIQEYPKVYITHKDFPVSYLPESYMDKLMFKLVDLMRVKTWEEGIISFHGYKVKGGVIKVNCNDELSRDWLIYYVTGISPFEGVHLKASQTKPVEGFMKIAMYIPDPVSCLDAALSNIKAQNEDLDTEHWKILPGGYKDNPRGIFFAASIPKSHYKTIERRKFKVNHGFHVVDVKRT